MSIVLGKNLAAADGEQVVKGYHVTSFRSRLLRISSEGYLAVTTKRVIFQAMAKDSVIHSEVPIDDVSGINLYRGTYFSWWHLLIALVVSPLLAIVLAAIISAVISGLAFAARSFEVVAVLPGLLAVGSIAVSFVFGRNQIWRSVFVTSAAQLLAVSSGFGMVLNIVGGMFGGGGIGGGGPLMALLGVAASIYAIVCYVWYATRRTVSLNVNSKGGANAAISIAGAGGGNLIGRAALALDAEPAVGADQLVHELGALIMDIQQRGEFGVDKWRPTNAQG